MLNRTFVLASCIAAAGMCLPVGAADNMTVTDSKSTTVIHNNADLQDTAGSSLPAGILPSSKDINYDVQKSFASLADAAFTKNGFDNVVNQLSDQDRDRIKKSLGNASYNNVDGNKNQKLNDLVKSFDDSWKAKYGKSFKVDTKNAFSNTFATIRGGEVSDPNLLVGKWPVDASMMAADKGGKVTPADAKIAKDKAFGGDVNLEKGRNVAIASIGESHGLPGINASLIHEALSGYKFDVPNTLTAQKLYDNLVANLSFLDQHKDQLPADINDGYRMVTHAVIASLYDIDLGSGAGTARMPMDNGAVRPTGTAVDNR